MSNLKNVYGNSVDFTLTHDVINRFSEIKQDVPVKTYDSIRLWGQVKDCDGNPIPYALLKLIRSRGDAHFSYYTGVAHTTADCQGYYQIDVCPEQDAQYKLLASKSLTGEEHYFDTCGNCHPHNDTPDPCESC